ncbi:YigZ family protein [Dokdonella sp.]|uniref:IMPACT family protein n=1 Tax=Dokdonella sp. TaxID=2291710 RepID=UPI0025C1B704|nr:YigZ family protein [Dokdonella sp.]MBX3693247.1 YigZ family protein [Dokdonella sp.]MCW5568659.1 YigZ family protein [Dokdonella sp.]
MSARHTLVRACTHTEEIRKSRFVAQAAPVDTPAAALTFVAAASDATATHNCWAYRIGQEYRFNDDGEPGGTAGRPILQAIDGQQVDRVVVVVTRWFGGIKLGAGGLVRAYGGCAAECLRLAERAAIVERIGLRARCDFATLPILQARLADFAAETRNLRFDVDGIELDFGVPGEHVERVRELVGDLTRGRGSVEEIHTTA